MPHFINVMSLLNYLILKCNLNLNDSLREKSVLHNIINCLALLKYLRESASLQLCISVLDLLHTF